MTTITPPIIISENGDIVIFKSKKAAEEYIEPADIFDLLVFDSHGNRLVVTTLLVQKKFFEGRD